jgi:hypothetical protein
MIKKLQLRIYQQCNQISQQQELLRCFYQQKPELNREQMLAKGHNTHLKS